MAQLAVHRPLDEGNLDDDLGAHPVCAHARKARRPCVNGDFGISSASSLARRSSSSFVSNPVPTLPAKTNSSPRSSRRAARPARRVLPCGSVNPPTTSSWAASHFILSQCGDRRCSYTESRRFAITPSQPSRAGAVPRLRVVERLHALQGRANGRSASSARRASSGSDMTSRPSSQRTSKT